MASIAIPRVLDYDDEEDSIASGSTVFVNEGSLVSYVHNDRHYENVEFELRHEPVMRDNVRLDSREHNYDDLIIATGLRNDHKRTASRTRTPLKTTDKWPELTPQHVLSVFIGSGISYNEVSTLAILLGLSSNVIDQSTGCHPYKCAMDTVLKWLKAEPLPCDKAHQILAKHFRQLKLNYLIPKLHGQQRHTAVDPQKLADFLATETKHFTREQAYKFGRLLNLNNNEIDAIAQQHRLQGGMDLVIHIFASLNKENTNLPEPIVERIATAVLAAASNTDEQEEVIPPTRPPPPLLPYQPITTEEQIHITVEQQQQQPTTDTDGPSNTEESVETIKWLKIKHIIKKAKYVWNGAFIILGILLIITIICLISLPRITLLPKQTITHSDVIAYMLPNSNWLTSIDIELQGPLLPRNCHARVISVLCDNIQYSNRSTSVYTNTFNYIYLEEDASVSIILNSSSSAPYFAWIFTDYKIAENSSAVHFKYFACATPPQNIWCIDLTQMEEFMAPFDNYYFIRCDRGPNCDLVNSIQVISSKYDMDLTEDFQIDSVSLYAHISQNLKLTKSIFHTKKYDVCLLMQLDQNKCTGVKPHDYQIAITKQHKRYDSLLYPCLLLCLVLVVFIALYVVKCIVGIKSGQ